MRAALRWLRDWWHARQRALDVQLLWPGCRRHAPDINVARAIFATHALSDPAWLALGPEEMARRIAALV